MTKVPNMTLIGPQDGDDTWTVATGAASFLRFDTKEKAEAYIAEIKAWDEMIDALLAPAES